MNILEQIIANKFQETALNKSTVPVARLKASAYFTRAGLSLKERLTKQTGIIAEFKRKSPSKGIIRHAASAREITRSYENHGASACSILTDKVYFGGDNGDIAGARPWLNIPVLRKDFIIDPYQIFEAKSIGADLILLIAECLTKLQINEFTQIAHDLGMEVLMELHDQHELDKWSPEIDLLGINNRDLKNFNTGIEKSLVIADVLPKESLWISESGLKGPGELQQLSRAGYRGFLIGETFMKSDDPGALCGEFVSGLTQPNPT